MKTTVPFSDLSKYTDSNSFVWTALKFDPKEKRKIEAWLKKHNFLPSQAKIISMRKITPNVKGDAGRTDVLFVTTPTTFNPVERLNIDGLKWTSDFITNYRCDYQ